MNREDFGDALDGIEVRASSIEGLGLFATRAYEAEDVIRKVNLLREITTEFPLDQSKGERREHCAYPDGKVVLWGFPDRHVNHRCDPNAYERYCGEDVFITARRAIASGEEITFDYNLNTSGGESWSCNCGAPRCRGESVGDFFRLPKNVQREYRSLLAEWFIVRHRDQLQRLDADM
jgi:hypothetical protein